MKVGPKPEGLNPPPVYHWQPRVWVVELATLLLVAAILALFCFAVSGCKTVPKGNAELITYKIIEGGLGWVETTDTKGVVKKEQLPWDATYEFRHGVFAVHRSGFKAQPVIGASCWQGSSGLEGSPWAGLRVVHIINVGVDFGFDKENITVGPDWLYHATVVGINACFPYSLGRTRAGLKAGYLF